jgi:hypothetical protein
LAAVLTEIHLCGVCSGQELLRRSGRSQEGSYVRRWLPQLARLDSSFIHSPWEASPTLLAAAGVRLGTHYPRRVVVNLEKERLASHRAVMVSTLNRQKRSLAQLTKTPRSDSLAQAVRNSAVGKRHTHRSGHEWLMVDGHRVTLITRIDYREGKALPEMTDAEVSLEVQTKMTAAERQDPRKLGVRRNDARSLALHDGQAAFIGREPHRPARGGGGRGHSHRRGR